MNSTAKNIKDASGNVLDENYIVYYTYDGEYAYVSKIKKSGLIEIKLLFPEECDVSNILIVEGKSLISLGKINDIRNVNKLSKEYLQLLLKVTGYKK